MGVYIKGMEMPKSCDECRIMVFEDTNCVPELFCGCPIVFKAHPQGVGHRPDYCPLIEVPTPHGQLIDIEPFMRGLYEEIQMGQITYTSQELYDMIDEEIKSMPTIIESEGE